MCPVGNVPAGRPRDRAGRAAGASEVAVNVHGSQPMLRDHVAGRVHVSVEQDERLGTAGALGRLRPWIAGRHVLVHNADSFVDDDLAALLDGWDGVRRGSSCAPRTTTATSATTAFSGQPRARRGRRQAARRAVRSCSTSCGSRRTPSASSLVEATGTSIDCGTPADYLRANLHVSGGVERDRPQRGGRGIDHPLRRVAGTRGSPPTRCSSTASGRRRSPSTRDHDDLDAVVIAHRRVSAGRRVRTPAGPCRPAARRRPSGPRATAAARMP